jgi:type IV secretion system protein VirB10
MYSADIKVGQERLLVASTSLRLPNGKSVPLNGMQGADQNGYAGFSGDVNNHFLKIFGTGFITAILLRAFDSGSQTATTSSPNGVTTYGSTAGQVAAATAQTVLQRNQNIPPTITVEPGQKFLVQVTQDIVMEPYHD